MDKQGSQNSQEIREGTEALQEIADEVSEGDVTKGDRQAPAVEEAYEAVMGENATTREDHMENATDADEEVVEGGKVIRRGE